MKFVELESERLLYRKFAYDDFPTVFDWMGNFENMKYRRGGTRSEAEARQHLEWAISNADAEDCENYEFAVVLKSDNSLIGVASLTNLADTPEAGWTIHRDYWNRGYGTEMGRTLLAFGFGTLGLGRITAGCNAENHASYRIMETIGMKREIYFAAARQSDGEPDGIRRGGYRYAILAKDYSG